MEGKVKEGAPYEIRLAHPVPVIWVYLSGWSNGPGPANFRDDVYGLDTVGDAVATAAPAPAPAMSSAPRSPSPAKLAASRLSPPPAVTAAPLPPPAQ